ncbi:MAG: gliding motility-associated ABC transporter ATP-binding subunit GldA [Candidatus Delongbacteria bacterium]|jgi:ABC-2 type transport system ATP-binding protein|nr:gliding motility-associated ABC transporter ATP-binding subunit GldA [Candidatus Delongbacteria bacterium]
MSIEVQNITKLYGKQKALDQVSFTVETGQIVGFIGPNGAGKTTAIRIITGNIPPTSGMAKVEGLDVNEHDLKVKKMIGYLPEDNPLYDDLYIREYLNYVAGIYKIKNKKNRVDEVIELTGLTKEIKKQIGALSKGYRQRVGLAQAIIHDPKVLILDEPTSGLDPNQIIEIRNLISLLGKKKTVILTTHIMQEVEAICDRVVIINNGKIVADDKASQLSTSDTDNLTVIVEFDKKVNASELKGIEDVIKVVTLKNKKYLLQSKSGNDIRPKLFHYAVKNDLTVLSMNQKAKSLEEVFQELTK